MHSINRRTFLKTTTKAAGAAIALSQIPSHLFAGAAANKMPIGFQTYTVRDMLSKDFSDILHFQHLIYINLFTEITKITNFSFLD